MVNKSIFENKMSRQEQQNGRDSLKKATKAAAAGVKLSKKETAEEGNAAKIKAALEKKNADVRKKYKLKQENADFIASIPVKMVMGGPIEVAENVLGHKPDPQMWGEPKGKKERKSAAKAVIKSMKEKKKKVDINKQDMNQTIPR